MEEALERIQANVRPLSPMLLPAIEALGCILASAVDATMDQPPFDRSPYDGYALRASDTLTASEQTPVMLHVVGSSVAGKPAAIPVHTGEAVRIMTGGAIPEGADCVIPQEMTDLGSQQVQIYRKLNSGDNFCLRGEDFKTGDRLVNAGIRVTAPALAVVASAGLTHLKVYPRPLAAVLSTGDELRVPGQILEPGQIYHSNAAFLIGRLKELGIETRYTDIIHDDLDKLRKAIFNASCKVDFILCTGGVSVGERDLVPAALAALGADVVFHGVDMKPGMPATLAMLNGKPILALSGNPFAAAVSFELLARPILGILSSDPGMEAELGEGVLADSFPKKSVVRRFQRAVLENDVIHIPQGQGNGQMRTMIGCNCLVELPEGEPLPAGSRIKTYQLEGGGIYGKKNACYQRS